MKPKLKNFKGKIILNKRNAKAFAKYIFSIKNGKTKFKELCPNALIDGDLHCAIGEAYYKFISDNDKKLNKLTIAQALKALVNNANLKSGVDKFEMKNALRIVM